MYYINPTPNKTGNHGNPMGQPFPTCVTLPDDLLSPISCGKGVCNLDRGRRRCDKPGDQPGGAGRL